MPSSHEAEDVAVEVKPTGAALGAEILEIDLCSPASEGVEGVYEALLGRVVVFSREIQLYVRCLADDYSREREFGRCVIDGDRPV